METMAELIVCVPTVVQKSVDSIRCILPVDYEEEDMPNTYPHRRGDTWDIQIDLKTGQIYDWPAEGAEPLDLYMKVCDGGDYLLMDGVNQVARIQDYVPKCIPGEHGDYINFKIDRHGFITNWKLDIEAVQDSFFTRAE